MLQQSIIYAPLWILQTSASWEPLKVFYGKATGLDGTSPNFNVVVLQLVLLITAQNPNKINLTSFVNLF